MQPHSVRSPHAAPAARRRPPRSGWRTRGIAAAIRSGDGPTASAGPSPPLSDTPPARAVPGHPPAREGPPRYVPLLGLREARYVPLLGLRGLRVAHRAATRRRQTAATFPCSVCGRQSTGAGDPPHQRIPPPPSGAPLARAVPGPPTDSRLTVVRQPGAPSRAPLARVREVSFMTMRKVEHRLALHGLATAATSPDFLFLRVFQTSLLR